jgi:hypothetical protein
MSAFFADQYCELAKKPEVGYIDQHNSQNHCPHFSTIYAAAKPDKLHSRIIIQEDGGAAFPLKKSKWRTRQETTCHVPPLMLFVLLLMACDIWRAEGRRVAWLGLVSYSTR